MQERRLRSDSEALNDAEAEAEAERSRASTTSSTIVARAPPRRVASPTGVQAVEDATIFADIIEQMKHTLREVKVFTSPCGERLVGKVALERFLQKSE